ncbi:MAG TPA: hypothetical protein VG056_13260, partial [Pirellulales bacterium]|jgi:hypothetical protein|nr:hypothetical protein [Pirellulales bacterium]
VEFPAWTDHEVLPARFNVPINQGFSRYGEFTYVLFHDPEIKIEDAVDVLRKRGLNVYIKPDRLIITEGNKPTFSVTLVRSNDVQATSAELAKGTEHAEQLSHCDARFEIGSEDADKILRAPKTLKEIQAALQELTRGYLYNTWDKALSIPR